MTQSLLWGQLRRPLQAGFFRFEVGNPATEQNAVQLKVSSPRPARSPVVFANVNANFHMSCLLCLQYQYKQNALVCQQLFSKIRSFSRT